MTDSQYVKAMPSKLRAVLVPIIKTIIDLKLRLTEGLAVVETRIRKIDDFLKRDDLTVEARVEAEGLRTPDLPDNFNGLYRRRALSLETVARSLTIPL